MVAALMSGTGSRHGYVLLLRNLLPAYRVLESALVACEHLPGLAPLVRRELFRGPALECDLRQLHGPRFEVELPLLEAGAGYAACVAEAAREDPLRLAAHAYTRYLGDLSGGVILGRRLRRDLSLGSGELAFYRFPAIARPAQFKRTYRQAIAELDADPSMQRAIVDEACAAFRHNIAVSDAVLAAASA
jgi:heme oxygenase